MMRKNVCHFLRKNSQLKASFIQNQIYSHKLFTPSVVIKSKSTKEDGGFADYRDEEIKILDLENGSHKGSAIKFRLLKLISSKDKFRITNHIADSSILHFHYGTDAGIFLPQLRGIKIPKVVSFYGYDCTGFPKRFWGYGKKYLQKRTFNIADKVLAMSEDMKQDLLALGCPESKLIVHYHGSDTSKFYNKHNYQRQNQLVRFLIVSELVPKKGHMFLLEAFREAYQLNKNIRLVIVGDGVMRSVIADFIERHSMESYVSLEGKTIYSSDKHKEYLSSSDVFIHPSIVDYNGDKEGIPGAIVEAMASGLPVISTYHAGIPYIIDHGETGMLVEENNVQDLRNVILKMADSQEIREYIGTRGQEYAREYLDLHIREGELEKIYNNLISNY